MSEGEDVPMSENPEPGSPAVAAKAKARRLNWQQWELSPMRQLREEGDGLDLVAETSASVPTLRASVTARVDAIQAMYPA